MSTATITPSPWQFFVDTTGLAAASYLLYIYDAGTTTLSTTWTDPNQSSQNTNPIQLNPAGLAVIYLAASSYDYVLKTPGGATVRGPVTVTSVGLTTSAVVEVFGFLGDPTSPITGTTYPVGATAVQCHAGTTFWSIDSNNIASGTYKLQGMLIGSGGATVTAALVNLTDASETPIVTIASASTTGALVQSSAITFAAGGVAKTYAIKVKVDTGSGEVWGVSVVKTA